MFSTVLLQGTNRLPTRINFFGPLHFTCSTIRLPTLFFIKDGKLRYRMEGALTAEELDQLVDYILFDGPAPTKNDLTPKDVNVEN